MIRVVAFDYNGVLTDNPVTTRDRLYAALGVEVPRQHAPGVAKRPAGPSPLHRLERGEITLAEFRSAIENTLPGAGTIWDPGSPWCIARHLPVRPDMAQAVCELHRREIATMIASNNANELWPIVTAHLTDLPFGAFVNSAAIGARKPEPEFYEHVLAAGAVEPSEVLFIDDHQPNVEAAHTFGFQTIHSHNHAETIRELLRRCPTTTNGAPSSSATDPR